MISAFSSRSSGISSNGNATASRRSAGAITVRLPPHPDTDVKLPMAEFRDGHELIRAHQFYYGNQLTGHIESADKYLV